MPLSDIRQGTLDEPDAGSVSAAAQHNVMWLRVRRDASPRIIVPRLLARPGDGQPLTGRIIAWRHTPEGTSGG